jgi:hypothetical protein
MGAPDLRKRITVLMPGWLYNAIQEFLDENNVSKRWLANVAFYHWLNDGKKIINFDLTDHPQRLSFPLDIDTHEEMQRLARELGVTISDIIRSAIFIYLKRNWR